MSKKKDIVKRAEVLLHKFAVAFPDDARCLDLLAELKWKEGFVCHHCGHTNFCSGKSLTSRRCTTCKREESVTAHTIFHHCRFSLRKAIELSLLLCHIPDISSYELSRQIELRHMTCYNFQKKMLACQQGRPENKLLNELIMEVVKRIEPVGE